MGEEPLRGYDCSYFHFHDAAPAHTLKCLILDTGRRGAPVTLDEVRRAIAPRLGLHPRARSRAVKAPHLPGRHTWFDDPEFDLDAHLGETQLRDPDGLDELCGQLATEQLPENRPLWHATLVHGVASGRQAVVFRIHHSVMDGVAAANTLRAFTTDRPGQPVPTTAETGWTPPPLPSPGALRRRSVAALPSWLRSAATFIGESIATRDERRADARLVRERDDLMGMSNEATYGWTGARFGGRRTCASASLPFAEFRTVKDHHGVSVNDVLVAVVGEAVAAEARHRGEPVRAKDEVAMFSIALDTDPDRLCGNEIMAISVPMHTRGEDLAARLRAIQRSNRDQIALTRRQQARRSVRITDLWASAFAVGARVFAYRIPYAVSNVVMANVPGPTTTRWLGDVEVVDFFSYAVLVQPIGINVTVYSYDDRMNVGLLTAPEVIDDPYRFLGHMRRALDELTATCP